jgi:hypothetical protein
MKRIYVISTLISALFLFNSCTEKKAATGEPKQLIKPEMAKDLNLRYNAERGKIITAAIGKEDANAAWYSIEELENYIAYVKNKGQSNNIEVTGIRIYLGVYPNDPKNFGEKAGMTTIFLAPTKKNLNPKGDKNSEIQRFASAARAEENVDVTAIDALNYGGMGNPPQMEYGHQ